MEKDLKDALQPVVLAPVTHADIRKDLERASQMMAPKSVQRTLVITEAEARVLGFRAR